MDACAQSVRQSVSEAGPRAHLTAVKIEKEESERGKEKRKKEKEKREKKGDTKVKVKEGRDDRSGAP
jgi:hypothetical protein